MSALPPFPNPAAARTTPSFLDGGGETGERMRSLDWTRTPLGDPQGWPQSLKTIVRVMLDSRYAMWMLWGEDLTFFCNDAYLPTVGLKRDWVLGARSDRVWEEIWPEIGPRIRQVLTRGEATWDEELQLFLERSGFPEETYHTFSYSPVYDDSSRIAGMLCVVTEVTDRVFGERQLRVLRDLAAQPIKAGSVEQICMQVCQVLARYPLEISFGGLYLIEAGQGRRMAVVRELPSTVLPAQFDLDAADDPWPVRELIASERTQEIENLPGRGLAVAAGPWPDLVQRALMLPLKNSGAQALKGFLILGASPRRVLSESYRGFLELVAAQAAAAIADAQAYREQRQRAEALAELDRAKTVFFSNVSHEFRTPLTLMLGPLEHALQSQEPLLDRMRGDLEVAHRNALRLLKLVNTLLDFSRLEAGRINASYEPLDLAGLTQDLASTFRSAVEAAGLRFEVRCQALPAQPWVDRDMWEKIILNLLSNALKYTHAGEIRLVLDGSPEAVELSVSDTGIGIPAESQPQLFDRFYRVPGAHGRTHEGSGIGLSLVSELVKQHGGRIGVQSAPGQGSRFTVTIPTGHDHLPQEQIRHTPTPYGISTAAHAIVEEVKRWSVVLDAGVEIADDNPERTKLPVVLLADDNADMREYVSELLGSRFRVVTAVNGDHALKLLATEHPDVVVSDVMMPELDGFGLLRAIREHPAWSELPVILLSARAGEEARIEGFGANADDYIVKPFAAKELLARISNQIAMGKLRREARQAVAASEERFRTALSSATVGFMILQAVRDHAGTVVDAQWRYVNPAAERLVGRAAEEMVGHRVGLVLPRTFEAPELSDTVLRVIETGVAADIEVRLRLGERERWFHNSITRFGDGVVIWFSDITERKQVEAELRELDRRKDEFLAILAHELRNPLAPIRQAAAILGARGATPEQLHRSQSVIERQVHHMARLLDDLLDVSRITRGTLELRREWLDVQSIVDAAIETSRPAIDSKRHTLAVSISKALPRIEVDGMRMAQVLSNLLTNAAKYTDPGGRIDLHVERDGGDLLIRVHDTGIGMEPEALPRVFEMFSQLRPALERSEGGLGIGLALVKGLVTLHGGSIDVHSGGIGQGSEFRVRIPLSAADTGAVAQKVITDIAATGRGRRVLVVDDNADAAESLAMLLSLDGHEVRTAVDADQALDVAAHFQPELAILDIGLPRKNGYELARDLRRQRATRRAILIALTGWGQHEDRSRAYLAGFDQHLTKPVDPQTIRLLVRDCAEQTPPDTFDAA